MVLAGEPLGGKAILTNKFKWYQRIFCRFDKLTKHFLGFLSFVASCLLIWFR
jgi:hypothetical protein